MDTKRTSDLKQCTFSASSPYVSNFNTPALSQISSISNSISLTHRYWNIEYRTVKRLILHARVLIFLRQQLTSAQNQHGNIFEPCGFSKRVFQHTCNCCFCLLKHNRTSRSDNLFVFQVSLRQLIFPWIESSPEAESKIDWLWKWEHAMLFFWHLLAVVMLPVSKEGRKEEDFRTWAIQECFMLLA